MRTKRQNAICLGIVRQSGAKTLEVADRAKALAEEMSPTLPAGMTISVGSDESDFISRAIDKVYHTLAEAAVMVVLVIFLFLGSVRATFIQAITVPICLLRSAECRVGKECVRSCHYWWSTEHKKKQN